MQELIDKFKALVDFREKSLEGKFGKNISEAFNYPENRFWYADHISPIDKEIIDVANDILTEQTNVEIDLKTIADVFANQTLKNLYLGQPNQNSTQEICK